VHASSNFARLSTLSSTDSQGHRKPITALLVHPTNPLQLITAAEDGTVKIWDWVEGRHVRTISVAEDGQVNQITVGQVGDKWWIFATVTNPKPGKKSKDGDAHMQYRVMRVPLLPQAAPTDDKPVAYLYSIGKLRAPPAAIMLSPRSTYVVALAGAKAYVYRLPTTVSDDKWKPPCVKFVSDQTFTCGAFAPDRMTRSGVLQEEWFATGDEKGVIRLWHGLGAAFRQLDAAAAEAQQTEDKAMFAETEKRMPTTSLHWHAHAVAAISFTSAGAQILSVGEESVLVQWHLASGKREYIPRLGGRPILSVAVRTGGRGIEEEFWMGFADGSLVRVGATTGAVSTIGQGVRLDPLRPITNRSYPIAVHPASKALVVPSSHPSTLQFIDPVASSVLFDLEVAPSNRVSRRDDKELAPVSVEHVAFSAPRDGRSEWMATVEGRASDEREGGGFVKTLKFWRWAGDRYIVNTQYPRPHGAEDITALAFGAPAASAEPVVVTSSTSGATKLWHVRQVKKSQQGESSFVAVSDDDKQYHIHYTSAASALKISYSAILRRRDYLLPCRMSADKLQARSLPRSPSLLNVSTRLHPPSPSQARVFSMMNKILQAQQS
jgi:NET1-associated nuclear protein 1 (U3 small nucleolar RNA-associated protein 17)